MILCAMRAITEKNLHVDQQIGGAWEGEGLWE